MIVVVKKKGIKKILIKASVLVFLVAMFGAYYIHMSEVFIEMEQDMAPKVAKKPELTKEEKLAIKLEKLIFKEAENIVDLIEQKNVRKIYVTKKNLVLKCDNDTNIEPLLIRYGTNAYYKNGIDYMTIAISLSFIVDENFEYES